MALTQALPRHTDYTFRPARMEQFAPEPLARARNPRPSRNLAAIDGQPAWSGSWRRGARLSRPAWKSESIAARLAV